ncbi:hypothetical protein B5X24_HaOG204072 [Helicoverpa armigera]|uniref:Uncharacterized protein n=1 Tax=Helicoverpa armigera TaxID=29058 RepID=A0A2W1BUG1_HELAM|nr:hypothetical protein B5X24_HaOG204072 [Helicoverpa armigera]
MLINFLAGKCLQNFQQVENLYIIPAQSNALGTPSQPSRTRLHKHVCYGDYDILTTRCRPFVARRPVRVVACSKPTSVYKIV